MNVQKYTGNGTEIFVIDPSNLNLIVQKVGLGLSRISDFPGGLENYRVTPLTSEDCGQIDRILQIYARNALEIAQYLNLGLGKFEDGEELHFLIVFKRKVALLDSKSGVLDLTGRGLTALPFIESFKKVTQLILTNNHLSVLPPQLAEMGSLKELNLEGNDGIWKRPRFLKGPEELKVTPFDNDKCDPEDWAQPMITTEDEDF